MSREDLEVRFRPEMLIAADDEQQLCETSCDGEALLETSSSQSTTGITWYKATFLVVNAALGAGLLNFPLAFHETGGVVSGNLAHLVFVIFAFGSLTILSTCATFKKSKSFQEVVQQYCGVKWNVVCSMCISLYCFVTCITFIIIIGDQFDRTFASHVGSDFCHYWYMNRKFTMTVASLLLIFPCCLKRIDGMQIMSYVGVFAVWYLVAIIITELASGSYTRGEVLIWDIHPIKIFNVVPTICFGYQCHVSSVPINSCLKTRDCATLLKTCSSAILVCFVVYTISANCGYLTFGSLVNGDILVSYDASKPYVLIAVILLAIKSWTTYPILMFCVREAVSDLYLQSRGMNLIEAANSPYEPFRRKLIAILLWMMSIVLAVYTPSLNIVIKLLGSLAAVFILIFPGMCLLSLCLERRDVTGSYTWLEFGQLIVAATYICIGVFTFGLAFSLGVIEILHPTEENPICI